MDISLFVTNPLLGLFSLIHSYVFFAALVFVAWLYLASRKGTANRAALSAMALLLAFLLAAASKEYFAIPRPCATGAVISLVPCPAEFSFPSVHTAVAFALALPFIGTAAFFPLLAFAIIVAFSRLYLGVHTPYDIAGGLALAVLCFGISWALTQRSRSLYAPKSGSHSYSHAAAENLRQFLHMCIGVFAILVFVFLGRQAAWYIFFAALLLAITLLGLIISGVKLGFTTSVFRMLSRARTSDFHEYDLGLVWLLGGISLILLTLDGPAAIVSLVALGIGDSLSTFFGKQGKNRLPHNRMKTWEGSFSMFGSCLPAVLLFGWLGIVWAVLVAFVESLPIKLDDNLTIALFCVVFFLLF